jgi:hypothetical protein
MERIAATAFGLLIGIVGLLTGFKMLRVRKELNRWATTRGKVIERGTYRVTTPNTSVPAFQHAALVKYSYEVDGKKFVNDYINPKRIQLPRHNTLKWAEKRAASFADEVTVHYNPADPAESFLLQTPKIMLYVIIGCSCIAILFGLTFLLPR